jgi:hypothetical protein
MAISIDLALSSVFFLFLHTARHALFSTFLIAACATAVLCSLSRSVISKCSCGEHAQCKVKTRKYDRVHISHFSTVIKYVFQSSSQTCAAFPTVKPTRVYVRQRRMYRLGRSEEHASSQVEYKTWHTCTRVVLVRWSHTYTTPFTWIRNIRQT